MGNRSIGTKIAKELDKNGYCTIYDDGGSGSASPSISLLFAAATFTTSAIFTT